MLLEQSFWVHMVTSGRILHGGTSTTQSLLLQLLPATTSAYRKFPKGLPRLPI